MTKPPPLFLEMRKVYTRRIRRILERKAMSPPLMSSPEHTKVFEPIEEIEAEAVDPETEKIEVVEESTLAEIYGERRLHTIPLNKLRLKFKLKQNPSLTQQVIEVDNTPHRYMVINKDKIASSRKPKNQSKEHTAKAKKTRKRR